jgi:hypothetical protein
MLHPLIVVPVDVAVMLYPVVPAAELHTPDNPANG